MGGSSNKSGATHLLIIHTGSGYLYSCQIRDAAESPSTLPSSAKVAVMAVAADGTMLFIVARRSVPLGVR